MEYYAFIVHAVICFNVPTDCRGGQTGKLISSHRSKIYIKKVSGLSYYTACHKLDKEMLLTTWSGL